jgi:hypothetical protein
VRLSVCVADADAAIALLNAEASAAEINQIEIEATASAPAGNSPMKKLAMGQIGFGISSALWLGYFFVCSTNGQGTSEPKRIIIMSTAKWKKNGYIVMASWPKF